MQCGHDGQAGQAKGASNRADLIRGNGCQLGGIVDGEIARHLFDTVDGDLARGRGINDDISVVCGAARDLGGICIAGDGDGRTSADATGCAG